jgi:transposase
VELEAARRTLLHTAPEASIEKVRQLRQRKGSGIHGAWLLVMAFFAWRELKTRREVGGLAGVTPTPYHSGARAREQGIAKAGNRHVRWMTTELAWSWVRYQPERALSCWFKEARQNSLAISRLNVLRLTLCSTLGHKRSQQSLPALSRSWMNAHVVSGPR